MCHVIGFIGKYWRKKRTKLLKSLAGGKGFEPFPLPPNPLILQGAKIAILEIIGKLALNPFLPLFPRPYFLLGRYNAFL